MHPQLSDVESSKIVVVVDSFELDEWGSVTKSDTDVGSEHDYVQVAPSKEVV